jgi:aminotransferase
VNRTVAAMPPSGIRRFFDLVATMKDVISLGVGEPDFVTPWHIREAAIRPRNTATRPTPPTPG